MAPLTISSVRKSFGSVPVVHGVDVDIADGEFVALVGPSGCGKSTLLRMIAGLESVTGGDIRIGGRLVNNLPPKERDVAMVFQNYALYPHMTVADNMGFSIRLAGRTKHEIDRRVAHAADILALTPLLARFPKQLSGGQRQRVAMGRAIVRDPQVFLFDEPLSNLDAKLRVQMRTEIKALHQRLGTTTVYVTHDQVEAMTMADRIVVMHDGIVEQTGEPLELYDRPANLFVAGFIGSPAMNMLAGRIDKGTFLGDDGVMLPLPAAVDRWHGRRIVYGIRPEHLDIHPEGIEASVVVVEPTGAESLVVVRIGEAVLNCIVRDRVSVRSGDTIKVLPRRDLIHLFDEATGYRLGSDEDSTGRSGRAAARPPTRSEAVEETLATAAPGKSGSRLVQSLRGYLKRFETYKPELHYMRGPGPAGKARRDLGGL